MRDVLELASPGRPPQHHRADHRRERDRQGGHRPRHPPDEPAARAQLHRASTAPPSRSSCSSPSCSATRKGAFTGATPTGPACSSWPTSGTLLLDEIGDLPLDAAGQAAPRAGGGRDPPGRRARVQARWTSGCMAATGQAAGAGGGARRVPRRPLLPAQRGAAPHAAAARAAGGHPGAAHPFRPAGRPAAGSSGERHAGGAGRADATTAGPATCASSGTRSSARRCCPPAGRSTARTSL